MEEIKKPGRPKHKGETSTETIHIRPWTRSQLNNLISPRARSYDGVITELILLHKKGNNNARTNNKDIQN